LLSVGGASTRIRSFPVKNLALSVLQGLGSRGSLPSTRSGAGMSGWCSAAVPARSFEKPAAQPPVFGWTTQDWIDSGSVAIMLCGGQPLSVVIGFITEKSMPKIVWFSLSRRNSDLTKPRS